MNQLRQKPLKQYNALTFLTILFITIFLICDITAFRMVLFFGNEIPLSGLIIPAVFALGDIIAEVYGYRIIMNVLKSAIFCQMLFGIIITIVLMSPSPPGNTLNEHYKFAFDHILRTNITSCFSVTAGMFANAFLISKLKIYTNGKKFWIRTLISSGISEIVLCTVAYLILFSGLRNMTNIVEIIYSVWAYKMIISILINPFITIIARYLKNYEFSDVYDHGISYNPFCKNNNHIIEFANELNSNNVNNFQSNVSLIESNKRKYVQTAVVINDDKFYN